MQLPRVAVLFCWGVLLSFQSAHAETRELVLSNWEPAQWTLDPSIDLRARDHGAELNVSVPGSALALINLPAGTQSISFPIDGPERSIELLVQDRHGWTKRAGMAVDNGVASFKNPLDPKQNWSWRVGFFGSNAAGPFRLHGFRFHSGSPSAPVRSKLGPLKIGYEPDNRHWLYADVQPKSIPSHAGALPPLTLRVANLGTDRRTFSPAVRVVSRNGLDEKWTPVTLDAMTLEPGEMKSVSIKLPLSRMGRYEVEYAAGADAGQKGEDVLTVVNALEKAEAFRDWASRRKWFDVKDRRPADKSQAGKDRPPADNGVSAVPIFPVQPRLAITSEKPADASNAPLVVTSTQLSPAWLVEARDSKLRLFTDSESAGLGAPTRLAMMTGGGPRVLKSGEAASENELRGMTAPWLLVWWEGARGYERWDVPHLVVLQHRPTKLSLDEKGVSADFAGPAGQLSVLPLYGYAKLPQKSAFEKNPESVRLPENWQPEQLRPWTWSASLPQTVVERCAWWSRALCKVPVNVHETFTVDQPTGSIRVKDAFDYREIKNDWKTEPLSVAPLSPTWAAAQLAGFPISIDGNYRDFQYPTMEGPYAGVEGETEIRYTLGVGPYLMQAADPDLTPPADLSTPARQSQAELLNSFRGTDAEMENEGWEYHDGNFVWNVQSGDFRDPALATGYMNSSSRFDRKNWLQTKAQLYLMNPAEFKIDERGDRGVTRRYIDGPGIGNWGASDWGDSGKLGTDMIWNVWCYAYNTGDYQTIADRWDFVTSLNVTPLTMTWLGVGRRGIAEMGDEAPPMLALARMAYAVGDRQTYAAAAYWYARELAHHIVKDGGFTHWREQWSPWHHGLEGPTETATNLWGTNAGWVGGGLHCTDKGENQWVNFYVRFDDVDTLRFHRTYATTLPRRVVAAATPLDWKNNYTIFFARTAVLGQNINEARTDFVTQFDRMPDTYITRVAASWAEFPPKLQTLIPATEPAIEDTGFAWDQMNSGDISMINPGEMPDQPKSSAQQPTTTGTYPELQWFWWDAPTKRKDTSGHWTFGRIAPETSGPVPAVTRRAINPVTNEFVYANGQAHD